MVLSQFEFRRVECSRDYQRELCKRLGIKHSMTPTRVKIITDVPEQGGWIYDMSSPLI